jgi:hypothetical protein
VTLWPDYESICLICGILFGMYFYRQTGWGVGGIITPGVLAMHWADPMQIGVGLACGFAVWLGLIGLNRIFGLYGRQRIAAAMLLALALRMGLGFFWPMQSLWLGWVVPGLFGADLQRFGLGPAILGTLSTALAAGFAAQILFRLLS